MIATVRPNRGEFRYVAQSRKALEVDISAFLARRALIVSEGFIPAMLWIQSSVMPLVKDASDCVKYTEHRS